jgi:hypothetical protein
MATQFLKVRFIFHPNYGCSLHTTWIKICNYRINNETSEHFFAFFMVKISSVYNLGSWLLFTSMEIKLVLQWYLQGLDCTTRKDWWWVLPSGEMPTAIIEFVWFRRMLLALKKGENFKSLTEWAEYYFCEPWVRYFPAQTSESTGHNVGTPPLMSRFFISVYVYVVRAPRSLAVALDPVVQCF